VTPLKTIAHLPVGLYDEIAIGKDEFFVVFSRYGYDEAFATQCREDKRFQILVNERRSELEKTGQLHVHRAQAVADMALTELAGRIGDPLTTTPVLLSIYQTAAKLGRLEPQNNAAVATGPGFSISIHLDGKPTEKVVEAQVIEHDDLGEPPAYLSNLNRELEYKE
jgi:hypothetical protein